MTKTNYFQTRLKMPVVIILILAAYLLMLNQFALAQDTKQKAEQKPTKPRLMYTTYFYTAGEAVLHGYEKDTKVRIASLQNRGTVWEGNIGRGETKLIPTGRGVFAFFSDKKASILVGTPSQCAVVGYWVRDQNGSYRSNHFFTQLPSYTNHANDRFLVWAWEDDFIRVTDVTSDKVLHKGKLKAGSFFEIGKDKLEYMPNHVLEIQSKKNSISVQVYYDEGFFVPSSDGRAAGKLFYTYIGDITNQQNDLQLFSHATTAKVKVVDLKTNQIIFNGNVEPGTVMNKSLSNRYVKITSDKEINVAVSPYMHYKGSYNEHHFGVGQEGGGIETKFLITTPGELWVFSYFSDNQITVINQTTKKEVYQGTLNAGQVAEVAPGWGYYSVKSSKGISVMGGYGACGAEFSPAGGMFEVDEQLFAVIQSIKEKRIERAKSQGKTLSEEELSAPLTKAEAKEAQKVMSPAANRSLSLDEIQERAAKIQSQSK